mmetsp:Transcript_4701/g.16383  ORF Transcript_4701/g.16383 Transcript_4701/m.16383 type:complete len:268 (-) Transcript_4701:1101-1904(-)
MLKSPLLRSISAHPYPQPDGERKSSSTRGSSTFPSVMLWRVMLSGGSSNVAEELARLTTRVSPVDLARMTSAWKLCSSTPDSSLLRSSTHSTTCSSLTDATAARASNWTPIRTLSLTPGKTTGGSVTPAAAGGYVTRIVTLWFTPLKNAEVKASTAARVTLSVRAKVAWYATLALPPLGGSSRNSYTPAPSTIPVSAFETSTSRLHSPPASVEPLTMSTVTCARITSSLVPSSTTKLSGGTVTCSRPCGGSARCSAVALASAASIAL